MKITVIGSGYVGLVTGACLAEMGNDVLCFDIDLNKVAMLRRGEIPIHEPGLAEIVQRNSQAGRLSFDTNVVNAARFGQLQFIAVGTPSDEDGSADASYVLKAARNIGRHMTDRTVIVNKSTVPVGTADKVKGAVLDELLARGLFVDFAVVSNPEFLKEGAAVGDFMHPDRIVIGANDPWAVELMRTLYAPFVRNHDRVLVMDVRSAELTKYAANAMLATRISFMNELALLAEKVGADIEWIRQGIGSDSRIGYHFLYAGCGYGGSCFSKDVSALIRTADEHSQSFELLKAVEGINERQKRLLVERITGRFGESLEGVSFAIWGLAFKPDTDDMREAVSRVVVPALLARGARLSVYDPVASQEARRVFGDAVGITYADSRDAALQAADALVILTEWKEFRSVDLARLRDAMRGRTVFDGRNLYAPALALAAGLEYYPIGRGSAMPADSSTLDGVSSVPAGDMRYPRL